jgi:hypothetical protein
MKICATAVSMNVQTKRLPIILFQLSSLKYQTSVCKDQFGLISKLSIGMPGLGSRSQEPVVVCYKMKGKLYPDTSVSKNDFSGGFRVP